MSIINSLVKQLGVKSIQNGIVSPLVTYMKNENGTSYDLQPQKIRVPINSVNPKKCLVLLDGAYSASSYKTGNTGIGIVLPILGEVSSTFFTIKPMWSHVLCVFTGSFALNSGESITVKSDHEISWQVIEFY